MSYRELRDFTEIMRSLGYPRKISLESFRVPNFTLVADVLDWLVQRYDPQAHIPDNIDTEDDRVEFLTTIATVLASKARLKMKTKRLYAADGSAVKELLKLARLLHRAHLSQFDAEAGAGEGGSAAASTSFSTTSKLHDIKRARELAREIPSCGARLHDLLSREKEMRVTVRAPAARNGRGGGCNRCAASLLLTRPLLLSPRLSALPTALAQRQQAQRFLDASATAMDSTKEHNHVEKSLRRVVNAMSESLSELEAQCAELKRDEDASQAMLQKRKAELARGEKQLRHLQSVRPTFQDDYDRLEGELDLKYSTYLERFRNLSYLEERLDGFRRRERRVQADAEAAVKEIRDQVHSSDAALIDGPKDEHGWHGKAGRNRKAPFGGSRDVLGRGGGGGGGGRGGRDDDDDASDGSRITGGSDDDSRSLSGSGDEDSASSSLGSAKTGDSDDDF